MKTRKLNITFTIPDDDLYQFNFEKAIYNAVGNECKPIVKVLPNTDHLKDNANYSKLYKEQKKAQNLYYEFINNNRK